MGFSRKFGPAKISRYTVRENTVVESKGNVQSRVEGISGRNIMAC